MAVSGSLAEKHTEAIRIGEEAVSKTVAPQGVGGSNPSASAQKHKLKKKDANEFLESQEYALRSLAKMEKFEPMYRLNMRKANGQVRTELSKGVLFAMASKWGDIINAIPSTRFCTRDEIVQLVWEAEKRNFRRSFDRTRKQIEEAVAELAGAGFLLVK